MFRPVALAGIAALLATGRASAHGADTSDVPRIDPSIEAVVTGGHWAAGAASGSFRLVQVAEGWEEARHRIFLQWLEEPRERGPTTVRTTGELTHVANVYSLADPRLSQQGGRWYVTVRAAERPLAKFTQRLTFELGPPGIVRRVRTR